jgi:HSP20 family protein
MDRLFDRFGGSFGPPAFRRMFGVEPTWPSESSFSFSGPAVDVTEDDNAYKITAELPDLEEKDVDITVSSEKRYEKEEENDNRYMSERAYGSFQRSFPLPDGVNRDKIAADLSKGVLTITLPESVQAQKPQQKIEVKAAA